MLSGKVLPLAEPVRLLRRLRSKAGRARRFLAHGVGLRPTAEADIPSPTDAAASWHRETWAPDPIPPEISPQIVGELQTAGQIARARQALANGARHTSLRPWTWGREGLYPQFLEKASGYRVVDTAGQAYVDWLGGFGSAFLGYGCPEVLEAVRAQAEGGPTLSMMHRLEVEVAEKLVAMIPCAESVAFGKNGSDAVSMAVRLARKITGRSHILQFGFHGFHDWYAGLDPSIHGIPEAVKGLVHGFPYGDLEALEDLFDSLRGEVAAIVMEPYRVELPPTGYLATVRELASANEALLIFDEVVTGFRTHRGGAQAAFGVVPDLACFGKAMAGGLPLSALVGRRELMEKAPEVGVDMTFRGETFTLAAARAALDILAQEPVAEHAAAVGEALRSGVAEIADRHGAACRLVGHPARLQLEFSRSEPSGDPEEAAAADPAATGALLDQLLRRGVLSNGSFLPTRAHDEASVAETLAAFEAALDAVLANGVEEPVTLAYLDSIRVEEGSRSELVVEGWLLIDGRAAERVDGYMCLPDATGAGPAKPTQADIVARQAEAFRRPDVEDSIGGAGPMGFRLRLPLANPLANPMELPEGVALRARQDGRLGYRIFVAIPPELPFAGPCLAPAGHWLLPQKDETSGDSQ